MSPAAAGGWALGLLAGALVGEWSCVAGAAPPGRSRSAPAARPPDPRAAIFAQRGCTECHAISAFGVKPVSDVGPDLTLAYRDVVNRYASAWKRS